MGQNFAGTLLNLAIITFFQYLRPKARTIHAVNFQDPVLHLRRTVHGGINRQIASLGMPSHIEIPGQPLGDHVQIFYGEFLARHRGEKGHVKIFLPPHDGLVRAPVGHIHGAVLQQESHGGKLGLKVRLVPNNVDITVQLHIAEAHTFPHGLKQRPVLFFIALVPIKLFIVRVLIKLLQGHRFFICRRRRHQAVEFQIGKLAEHQAVHIVHGLVLQAYSGVFFQIINDCSLHGSS